MAETLRPDDGTLDRAYGDKLLSILWDALSATDKAFRQQGDMQGLRAKHVIERALDSASKEMDEIVAPPPAATETGGQA